ncbi:MAG: hypothetical protein Q8O67_10500 [Deltaproteobacteria bacterium]|nr:hypothetical protein [Deltaproteobacteria bacterium]
MAAGGAVVVVVGLPSAMSGFMVFSSDFSDTIRLIALRLQWVGVLLLLLGLLSSCRTPITPQPPPLPVPVPGPDRDRDPQPRTNPLEEEP